MLSDSDLQFKVANDLKGRSNIDDHLIKVAVSGNVVTLSGEVLDYAEKEAAENAAKSMNGVEHVINDIKIETTGSPKRSDRDIIEDALRAIKRDFQVRSEKILVLVADGWLTLAGNAECAYQKEAAMQCVQHLDGVEGITNSIIIRPAVNWFGVKNAIEDTFRRSGDFDSQWIAISTHEDTVRLSGIVSSDTERSLAVNAAYTAPGVKSVQDDLIVGF